MLQSVKTANLTPNETIELKVLENECKAIKSAHFNWDLIERKSERASTFLFYQGEALVAYCRYFFFYQDMAEVIIYGQFDDLRKANFKEVLKRLKEELASIGFFKICILSDFLSEALLKKEGFTHFECELTMEKSLIDDRLLSVKEGKGSTTPSGVREASFKDIPEVMALDKTVFDSDNFLTKEELIKQISSSSRDILLIKRGDLIAKVHLNYKKNQAVIANLCVHKSFLRQGLAKALIRAIEEKARQIGVDSLSLSVDEKNKPAVMLYQKAGFSIVKKDNYFTLVYDK